VAGLPLWGWIAIGAGVLLLAFVLLAIWAYPRDGSF
jgi:hypothetical protein